MSDRHLSQSHCAPCEGGVEPLRRSEFEVYLPQVPGWEFDESDTQMSKEFVLGNFSEALAFVNKVGKIAEAEGHHPDILVHGYKKVKVMLTTHAIGGLSINDFVVAAKVEECKAG